MKNKGPWYVVHRSSPHVLCRQIRVLRERLLGELGSARAGHHDVGEQHSAALVGLAVRQCFTEHVLLEEVNDIVDAFDEEVVVHVGDDLPVARYLDGPPRFLPGLEALHRMTGILLAERVPEQASLLVLGAGGGMELKALAEAHPGWLQCMH